MSFGEIVIRPVAAGDEPAWRDLYRGYAAFYEVPMTDEILSRVFGWLMDPAHILEGLVMERDSTVIGLAHFRLMPSPLRGTEAGFLDDLFIHPDARGSRLGERMLDHLKKIATDRGWPFIRWITADDTYRARTLYDRVAQKTAWNLYQMDAE